MAEFPSLESPIISVYVVSVPVSHFPNLLKRANRDGNTAYDTPSLHNSNKLENQYFVGPTLFFHIS